MYSQEAIDILINRIGWSELSSGLPFGLTASNKTADSGKMFNWYHSSVLVDNVYAAVPEVEMNEVDFNDYLGTIRKQAVLTVLTSILDTYVDYDPVVDYSNVILQRPALFDDSIGYSVSIKMLELYLSTSRSNFFERNAKMSYQSLKVELEGARNDNGHFVAKGIIYKLEQSIKKAQKIIFPYKIVVNNANAW
ncbi:hypothetical protein [Flavobacterium tructae]|uniref:Uncharacterized protein n=1 Tax=Flavobacterium tructae TaxID=1114873 RepID=A0A1S1J1E8_9FLAO|nr:hypothetical protein [Flavobacterium tructae]OHT44427.1 hypothetical protein BHE19_11950 [Flavobacterium tructae]OXB19437.1 hypothetical protein B0A71_12925 [Flavobacterium tructae]